jgi:hypothetical protein
LWINTFVLADGTGISQSEASDIYTNLGYVIAAVNVALFYPMGMLADKIPPKIAMPIAGLAVGLISCSMMFIKDPHALRSYVIWSFYSLAFVF